MLGWFIFGVLSAFTASIVGILSKLSTRKMDFMLATTIRAIVVSLMLLLTCVVFKKFDKEVLYPSIKDGLMLALSTGIFSALSWLFYFAALKFGLVTKVAAVSQLTFVFVTIMSVIILAEPMSLLSAIGLVMILGGVYLIALT